MKFTGQAALILTGLLALSAAARDADFGSFRPSPPNRQKLSYAMGMRMGMQLKSGGLSWDRNQISQGVKDGVDGKTGAYSEAELQQVFQQAQTYAQAKSAEKSADGTAAKTAVKLPEPPNKEKISYAMGLRLGQQLNHTGATVDLDAIMEAVADELDGKPTQLQESEIQPLFAQAQAYDASRQAERNKMDGAAFLATNARGPGITVLPDGLQYRVLQPGAGAIPGTNDLIMIKYRGTFINGTEFERNDHFVTKSIAGIKGWQEALQRMKIGAKWQLFVPPDLAYGHTGLQRRQIAADAVLVYELEVLSIIPPGGTVSDQFATGRMGHGFGDENAPRPAAANTNVPPTKN
jgi:FKBP-type peptidyl-prolyl cis-trans isomerase